MRGVDRRVYEEEISPWLPPEIVDVHVHIGLKQHVGEISADRIAANWALEVGVEQSWNQLHEVHAALLPNQTVSTLVFGGVFKEVDVPANNDYVLAGVQDTANKAWGLAVTRPEWAAEVVEGLLNQGFIGIKPYPDLAPADSNEVSIFDFLPRKHLAVVNDAGGLVMLHLPRAGRLADPDNIREIKAIAQEYPSIRIIVAHIGRSFCLPTAQAGLPQLVGDSSIFFDIAANLNADVFRYALETVGEDRILYGSDLPITLMRGAREHVGEEYINYTDAPYSWNVNRKALEEEAHYTFFVYEELRALISAVKQAGLGQSAIEKITRGNAARLIEGD